MRNAEAMTDSSRYRTLRTNIEYAAAAGLSTAFPLYLIAKHESEELGLSFPEPEVIFILSALPSLYLFVAVIFWLCRKTVAGRSVPHWLGISLIGSQLFMPSMLFYATIAIHEDEHFITFEWMMEVWTFCLIISAFSSIATATVRYSPSLIAALKTRAKKR
ncbi:MAG: hypothetical protein ICV68_07920 [Pyrinomonadaceae bacterium]|nr:hypothetical protein [Pyrinomonadaceae bacterium]